VTLQFVDQIWPRDWVEYQDFQTDFKLDSSLSSFHPHVFFHDLTMSTTAMTEQAPKISTIIRTHGVFRQYSLQLQMFHPRFETPNPSFEKKFPSYQQHIVKIPHSFYRMILL